MKYLRGNIIYELNVIRRNKKDPNRQLADELYKYFLGQAISEYSNKEQAINRAQDSIGGVGMGAYVKKLRIVTLMNKVFLLIDARRKKFGEDILRKLAQSGEKTGNPLKRGIKKETAREIIERPEYEGGKYEGDFINGEDITFDNTGTAQKRIAGMKPMSFWLLVGGLVVGSSIIIWMVRKK